MVTAFTAPALLLACSGTSKKNKQPEPKHTAAITIVYKKPPSSFSDTIIITGSTAVFYNADSLQLEKIKTVTKKMVYESNVHDCFYQMRNARLVLKKYWPLIQITEVSKARFLLFISSDKSKKWIDINTQNDQCGIFLFDDRKNPKLVDMMNIDTELGDFFLNSSYGSNSHHF